MWLKGADAALSDGRPWRRSNEFLRKRRFPCMVLKRMTRWSEGGFATTAGFTLLPESVTFEEVVRLLRSESHLCDESQLETMPAGTMRAFRGRTAEKRPLRFMRACSRKYRPTRGLRPCGPRYEVISFRLSDVAPGRVYRFCRFQCVASLRMRDAVRIDMLSVEENERVYPKGAKAHNERCFPCMFPSRAKTNKGRALIGPMFANSRRRSPASSARRIVLLDEPMAKHTTFLIGGPADAYVIPQNVEDVAAIVRACRQSGVPYRIVGNGSDLLVADEGLRCVIVQHPQ